MNHIDQYDYPVFAQATPSFPIALQIVTGQAGDLSVADKVKTLHTVVSFAMGVALPHDHPEGMHASPDLDALMAWASDGTMKGFNWKGLIAKLLPLILTLLAETE